MGASTTGKGLRCPLQALGALWSEVWVLGCCGHGYWYQQDKGHSEISPAVSSHWVGVGQREGQPLFTPALFHRSTGSSQTPEPRPWVSALLLQTWRSRFHCRFQNEYCFSSLCWLKPPKCSIFTFYITLIPNSIIFNNGLIQHFLQKRGGRTSPEHED